MRTRTLMVLAAIWLSAGAVQAQTQKPETPSKPTSKLSPEAKFLKVYPKGIFCGSVPCYVDILVKARCAKTIPTAAMPRGVQGDVVWRIDPKSDGKVLFTDKGIKPVNKKTWDKEFNNERPGATEYTWYDLNPNNGTKKNQQRKHGYRVEVSQGGKTCPLDPIIINDY